MFNHDDIVVVLKEHDGYYSAIGLVCKVIYLDGEEAEVEFLSEDAMNDTWWYPNSSAYLKNIDDYTAEEFNKFFLIN